MGQQQLLLIVLGVIIVGIAVVVGINVFTASGVQANRDAVISDLVQISSMAQQYYKKPTAMAGGGNSYAGFAIPAGLATTPNGAYTISVAGDANGITFQGVGVEKGDNGTTGVTYTQAVTATAIGAATKTN